ncbi:MAG: hypothetical protein HZA51_14235 [Planctomycetes bacterium]|nr:hypothetical protein [Planctomycetota bacterium]
MTHVSAGFPRWMVTALLLAVAVAVHGHVSASRSQTLLEHDEAISLMAAAGKSHLAHQLYQRSDSPRVSSAGELQHFMQYTGTTGFWDVLRSLANYDIHPPFYFLLLQGAERLGITSHTLLRLFGLIIMSAAAWVGHRYVWPDAAPPARALAAAWLLLSPTCIELATQLRQYPLVWLGTMLSLAGLVRLTKDTNQPAPSAVLIGAGPLVLLASHFGTAVWIVILVLCGAWIVRIQSSRMRQPFIVAVAGALVLASPLLYWWWKYAGDIGAAPSIPPARWWNEILRPMFDSLGHAWASWPNRWDDTGLGPVVGIGIAVIAGVLAVRRRATLESILGFAIVAWVASWMALLAAGKMPAHAVMPKYLAPLMLGVLTIIVRSTARTLAPRMRTMALTLLLAAMLSHGFGMRQALARPKAEPLMDALARCECLLINVPKRGFVLPLVAPMHSSARVIVATPEQALRDWSAMETLLPTNDVLAVEVMQEPSAEARELANRLKRKYEYADRLRDEPARVMTWYRRPSGPWKMR